MRRLKLVLIACSTLWSFPALSEELPELSTLHTPDSPAFVVLGVSPTDIQRPTSVKDFALGVANSFRRGSDVVIPENFAVEVAPYWLFPHHGLTMDDADRGSIGTFYRRLTLSIATASPGSEEPNDQASETPTASEDGQPTPRSLGAGIRTTLFHSGPTESEAKCKDTIRQEAQRVSHVIGDTIARELAAGELLHDEAAIEKRRQELADDLLKAPFADCIAKYVRTRGFAMDLAFAIGAKFPDERFEDGDVAVWRGWVSTAYAGDALSAVLLARLGRDDLDTNSSETQFDFGARAILAAGRFGIGGEAIGRYIAKSDVDPRYRLAAIADARIVDNTWLTFSMGRDYGRQDSEGEVLAQLGLKWELGERRLDIDAKSLLIP